MSFENILVDHDGGVVTVTINRPDKLNALNAGTLKDLKMCFAKLNDDETVRSVILRGAGDKSFVAGADIAEFQGMTRDDAQQASEFGQSVFSDIENSRFPVIAAVNGFALGGGLELALSADFRLCSEKARFGLPEVKLGLIPGYGGTQRLAQEIGPGRAAQMIATADMIDAETAARWGLVNEICAPEALHDRAHAIAATIGAMAPLAVSRALSALQVGVGGGHGYAAEATSFGDCFETNDMKEGVAAFVEKRAAEFKGT